MMDRLYQPVTVLDLIAAVARYYGSRLRRRFNADTRVWMLAQEIDFAVFCRQLKEPAKPDPCLRSTPGAAWPNADLDFDDFPDEMHGTRWH